MGKEFEEKETISHEKVVPIAEAKNNLPVLVHSLESAGIVKLSRRGKIVAYLLSADYYRQLLSPRKGFFTKAVQIQSRLKTKDLLEDSVVSRKGGWKLLHLCSRFA